MNIRPVVFNMDHIHFESKYSVDWYATSLIQTHAKWTKRKCFIFWDQNCKIENKILVTGV